MKHIFKISLFALLATVIVASGIYFGFFKTKKNQPVMTLSIPAANTITNTENNNQTPSSTIAVTTPETKPILVPPIDNFLGRITLIAFGDQPSKINFSSNQYTDMVCSGGKFYSGYHTAVDLELTPQERETAVPVYSIADGVVRQANTISGYGGLMVVEYTINGQIYTAYYGHGNVNTFTVKVGDKVTVGQKLAELAPACTPENGNNRKHLHFALHKGTTVVVAGYVNTKAELDGWVDPREIIN